MQVESVEIFARKMWTIVLTIVLFILNLDLLKKKKKHRLII